MSYPIVPRGPSTLEQPIHRPTKCLGGGEESDNSGQGWREVKDSDIVNTQSTLQAVR